MKTLVTGSAGFAGRWLAAELVAAGHEIGTDRPAAGRVDVTDGMAVRALVAATRPDLVIHLAAVSFGPQAEEDVATALRVNLGGTLHVLHAIAAMRAPASIVVVGSADVYSPPDAGDPPLDEAAPLRPSRAYGLTKLAQEAAALQVGAALGIPVVVVRPFNHTGPGQRLVFAVPAFADRILEARATGRSTIVAGNVDVVRDIGDVRDTVRAYRLIGEALAAGSIAPGRSFNVATGAGVTMRALIERLATEAGHPVQVQVAQELVRPDDPPRVVGDATALRAATGWSPAIPLETTVRDVLADVAARRA